MKNNLWILKPILIIMLCSILISCNQDNTNYQIHCANKTIKIDSINVLWKSGNDNTQWVWFMAWMELWVWWWALIWWPIGAVVWWIIWWVSWMWLGSLKKSTDYEVNTIEWKFICQEKQCENIIWETFTTDWKYIIKEVCK